MQRKRFRTPKPKPGELRLLWGKLPHDNPDIIYLRGEGTHRADSRLLHYMFSSKRYAPGGMTPEPSFLEELENRGYDITTIKFSISKKDNQQIHATTTTPARDLHVSST